MSFTVAIIGRPNVGKSTLFNRLAGRRLAIVHDQPGVTRDRKSAKATLLGLEFEVIDTAGLEDATDDSLEGRMRQQTERALDEADVALFLIDARAGVTPLDAYFADILRRSKTPVVLIANKCEGKAGEPGLYESYSLGLGEPVAISAEHGTGMGDLLHILLPYSDEVPFGEEEEFVFEDEVAPAPAPTPAPAPVAAPPSDASRWVESWDKSDVPASIVAVGDAGDDAGDDAAEEDLDLTALAEEYEGEVTFQDEHFDPERPIQLAIVGRPNTGKSTLVNRLLGEDRQLTGPEAGVTRDSIECDWEWQGRRIRLVDTAGLRRKARIEDSLERLSASGTLNSIRMAEVVVLVLDANLVMEKQDLTIARMVVEEGRALVIAINKWDACEDRKAAMQLVNDRLQTSLPQVRGIPFVTLSALRGQGTDALMEAVFGIHKIWNTRVQTRRLNEWLEGMLVRHPPPLSKQNRRIKLRYITQVKARPPTFAIFASRPDELPDSYMRYLANGLRDAFGLDGTPIRIFLRKPKNPYVDK